MAEKYAYMKSDRAKALAESGLTMLAAHDYNLAYRLFRRASDAAKAAGEISRESRRKEAPNGLD
ncbi:MAG: hypothetical protein ABFE13_11980 [Phycisphaerales bacterium]